MTHGAIDKAVARIVQTPGKALAVLAAMERELTAIKTYDELRRVIREVNAINVLHGHVAAVKAQAEDTILIANRRIGEEIGKTPKATAAGPGRGKRKQSAHPGKLFPGRQAIGIPGQSRSRLQKLAGIPITELKDRARALRAEGKDATVRAVVTALMQGNKKERRAARERALAARICALPDRKFGLIVCDDEWDHAVY